MRLQERYTMKAISLGEKTLVKKADINECLFTKMINELLPAEEKLQHLDNIDWLLKIEGSEDTSTAQKQFKNLVKKNFTYNDKEFKFWLSTPSDMKKNSAIFVRADKWSMIKEYEKIVSNDWLTDSNLLGKEVSINKDINRLALFMSSGYMTSIQPKRVIIPDTLYKTTMNIRTFKEGSIYELEERMETLESTPFDGQGIMSLEVAKRIKKDLELEHEVFFAGFRIFNGACKGLLVAIDFMKYFKELYKAGNTPYLRKNIAGQFKILDAYGDWQTIDNNTLLLPQSTVKWHNNVSSMRELEEKTDKRYSNILNSLFVTKTNKSKSKIEKENKFTSYQLLTQLALTMPEYFKLASPTHDFLASLLAPSKSISGEHEISLINKETVLKYLSVYEDEETGANLGSKISTLLSADYETYSKEDFVRKEIALMIEKTAKNLASGKIYIEGSHFKTLASEPLAFLDFVATRELNGTLGKKEFWCNSDEKVILAGRYPIAMYSEIQKINLVNNDLYKKYCSHWTKELLVFNIKDITAYMMSGADFDTDVAYTTTNKILINSIIPPKNNIPFVPMIEGGTKKVVYSPETRVNESINAFGNLIGSIAITNSIIANQCQDLGIVVNGKNIGRSQLFNKFLNNRNYIDIPQKEKEEFWRWYNSQPSTHHLAVSYPTEVKNEIKERFYSVEHIIARTVEESMKAIDYPKTGKPANLDAIKQVKKEFAKNPYFFYLIPDKDYKKYNLDNMSNSLYPKTGKPANLDAIKQVKKEFAKNPYFFYLIPDKDYKKYNLDNMSNSLLSFYASISEENILKRVSNAQQRVNRNKSYALNNLFNTANMFEVDTNEVNEAYNLIEKAYKEFTACKKEYNKKTKSYKQIYNFITGKQEDGMEYDIVNFYDADERQELRKSAYTKEYNKKTKSYKQIYNFITGKQEDGMEYDIVNFYDADERQELRKSAYTNSEIEAYKVYNNYSSLTVSQAVAKFMSNTNKAGQKFIMTFFFKSIELMINNKYSELEVIEKSVNGKEVLFERYIAKKVKNKNYKKLEVEGSVGNKELANIQRKIDIMNNISYFVFNVFKANEVSIDSYVLVKVENGQVNIYNHNGELLGNVFAGDTNKTVNMYQLDNCTLQLQSSKINNRSYTLIADKVNVA